MAARIGVVVFPGTNCELDAAEALRHAGATVEMLWHQDRGLSDVDGVVIPGGFAHGDYLRPGAIARFSPIMEDIRSFADRGRPIIGICNGFQILTEAGLLPGALQKNAGLKFLCQPATIRVTTARSCLTRGVEIGRELSIPINHFEGNYTCDAATLDRLRADDRIVFSYVDNPNGSTGNIAGVCNEAGNVVGLMPHPERAVHRLLGSTDGSVLFSALISASLDRAGAGVG